MFQGLAASQLLPFLGFHVALAATLFNDETRPTPAAQKKEEKFDTAALATPGWQGWPGCQILAGKPFCDYISTSMLKLNAQSCKPFFQFWLSLRQDSEVLSRTIRAVSNFRIHCLLTTRHVSLHIDADGSAVPRALMRQEACVQTLRLRCCICHAFCILIPSDLLLAGISLSLDSSCWLFSSGLNAPDDSQVCCILDWIPWKWHQCNTWKKLQTTQRKASCAAYRTKARWEQCQRLILQSKIAFGHGFSAAACIQLRFAIS